VHLIWPMVKNRIANVFARFPSDTTIEATERDVLSGAQLLWVAWDGFEPIGAVTSALYQTPRRKICSVVVGFGEAKDLPNLFFPLIEAYARAEGCSNLRLSGREGWARVLKDFRQPWIVLDKDLT